MDFLNAFIIIALLIFFHELGHFIAARYMGVKVEKFSIGFGKAIIKKEYKGTEYILALIPLGGFVQMKGQNDFAPDERSDDADSYDQLKPWQRIIILFAGPLANFIVAFVIYCGLALTNYQVLTPKIGKVMADSPASLAGVKRDDVVKFINGVPIEKWGDIAHYIPKSQGKLRFNIQRDNQFLTIDITPKIMATKNIFGESIDRKMVGITASGEVMKVDLTLLQAIDKSIDQTINATHLIFQSVVKLIEGVVSPREIGGVIAIVDVSAKASEIGITALLGFMALISVNLGLLNLLPIPALDGGHIMFNIYEIIFRRPPQRKVFYALTIMGWAILLA